MVGSTSQSQAIVTGLFHTAFRMYPKGIDPQCIAECVSFGMESVEVYGGCGRLFA